MANGKSFKSDLVLNFMAEYGRAYMSSGGPTSRLEEDLSVLGRRMGYPTEVFATPTGVFVSCIDENGDTHTSLCRIKESSMNLEHLCWLEGIFSDVQKRKISLAQGLKLLLSPKVTKPAYTFWQTVMAAFVSGFALSLTSYGRVSAAVASGFITVGAWYVSGPGLKARVASSIFRDFIGCVLTLALASLMQVFSPAPFEAFSIGGLIVLVPGLTLTTAISELADQNLVSGTAKLMQAILTLLAMGLAFLLFKDLSLYIDVESSLMAAKKVQLPLFLSALGLFVSISCFGILFRVPIKSLPWSALTGVLGWSVLHSFQNPALLVTAPYFASLVVGILSLGLGRRLGIPSQVFSVPGIIAMMPGMLALTSFNSIALGKESSGLGFGFQVMTTTGAVVFGLFTARIPFSLGTKRDAGRI